MNLYNVAKSHNDEYFTPTYAVKPIIKYLKKGSRIWCPFDKDDSMYVKVLRKEGFDVINTHIDNGEDFFEVEVPECDYIVSNPPFSKKHDVLERLFKIGIPFAMLIGDLGLFSSKRKFEMFKNNKFELMYFDKRISYLSKNIVDKVNPPFLSIYVCHNLLPKQMIFEVLNKG
ncbi:sugar-phospahte nucleotidyltransferase [Clostridium perfringens]